MRFRTATRWTALIAVALTAAVCVDPALGNVASDAASHVSTTTATHVSGARAVSAGGGGGGGTPLPNDATIYGPMAEGGFYLFRSAELDCGTGFGNCSAAAEIQTVRNGDNPGTRDVVFAAGARPTWQPTGGPDSRGCAQFDGGDFGTATGFSFVNSAGDLACTTGTCTNNPSLQMVGALDLTDAVVRVGAAVYNSAGDPVGTHFLYTGHKRTANDFWRANAFMISVTHNEDFTVAVNTTAHLHEAHAYTDGIRVVYDGTIQGVAGKADDGTRDTIDVFRLGGNDLGQNWSGCISEVVVTEGRTQAQALAYRCDRVDVEYPSLTLAGCADTEAPVASTAGSDTTGTTGTAFNLTASASTDNVGITSYAWTRTAGLGTCTITDAAAVTTTATCDTADTQAFQVQVCDAAANCSTASVSVVVSAGGTPFVVYSPMTYEELPTRMRPGGLAQFDEPAQPTTTTAFVTVSDGTCASLLSAIGTGNTRTRVTANIVVSGWCGPITATNFVIEIADAVAVDGLQFDGSSTGIVRGMGSTSELGFLRLSSTGNTDLTFDSLQMPPGNQTQRIRAFAGQARIAFVSIVAHASTGDFALWDDGIDILFAGTRFVCTFDNAGVNDWLKRFSEGDQLVIVDSMWEVTSPQHVLRNGGSTFPAGLNDVFFFRSRSINETDGTGLAELNAVSANWFVEDSFIHARNTATDTLTNPNSVSTYTNNTWYTGNASNLAGPVYTADGDLTGGATHTGGVYNAWAYPTWTSTTSPNTGITMAVADPRTLL